MKKGLQILAVALLVALGAKAQTQMVTFQVQSPDSIPVYVFGSWSNWSNWPGTPMTSIGGGKYTATIAVASNAAHEYLFVNGNSPQKEILDPAWTCTNGNVQYTNRVVNIGSVDTGMCATWATCNTCTVTPPPPPPTPVNVTFQVSAPDSLPVSVIGSWNWANYPGVNMTLVAPNTYAATFSLMPNAPYEFLFVNGATPAKEVLMSTMPCTNGNVQYTNRTLNLGGNDTAICFEWETCNTCTIVPPPTNVNVRFQVSAPDSTPVFVFGSWSNWSNFPGDTMVSIGSNIHEKVISVPANATYEYLYVNGTTTKEVLDPAWSCTNGNGQYTNRVLPVGTADFTKCNKWASCDSCGAVVPSNINVKFAVQATDSIPVYVFGSWSNWSNFPGTPMLLNIATGNYEATIAMASNAAVEYLYVNGSSTKEVLNSAWTCTNGNTQFTNRVATLGATDTSFCNRWEECTSCYPLSLSSTTNNSIHVLAKDGAVKIITSNNTSIDKLEIYDAMGKLVYVGNNVAPNQYISTNTFANALYVVRLQNAGQVYNSKFIVK
jgi:hypothetical protein